MPSQLLMMKVFAPAEGIFSIVYYSPDGTKIVSGSNDGTTLQVWGALASPIATDLTAA